MNVFSPEKLRAAISRANLTIDETAKRAGLSPFGLYKLLDGSRPDPKASTLSKLAAALHLQETDFLAQDTRISEVTQ